MNEESDHEDRSERLAAVPPFGLPDDRTLEEYSKELETQTDRGVAVLGVGFLEWRVRTLIKIRCAVWDKHAKRIFESGRLGFYENSEVAYSLGMIGPIMLSDIHRLCEIRNKFAHNPSVRSFDHFDVVTLIKKIETLKHWEKRVEALLSGNPQVGKVHAEYVPRRIYITTVSHLASNMWMAARHFTLVGVQAEIPETYRW